MVSKVLLGYEEAFWPKKLDKGASDFGSFDLSYLIATVIIVTYKGYANFKSMDYANFESKSFVLTKMETPSKICFSIKSKV